MVLSLIQLPKTESECRSFLSLSLSYASILPPSTTISTPQSSFKCICFSPTSLAPVAVQVSIICSMYNCSFHESTSVTSVLFLPIVSLHGAQDNISEKLFFFFFIWRVITPADSKQESFELGLYFNHTCTNSVHLSDVQFQLP